MYIALRYDMQSLQIRLSILGWVLEAEKLQSTSSENIGHTHVTFIVKPSGTGSFTRCGMIGCQARSAPVNHLI